LFRFTRFGLATRAAAESEKGALVSSIPADRLAAINWMISSAVAGLAGILIAPIVPLVPTAYTLFIVPALAAAILGRLEYLSAAVAGGLAIGMLQSLITYISARHTWLPQTGLPELVPLVLVLLVLVARARPLPSRGALAQRAVGRAPRPNRLAGPTVVSAVVGVVALILMQHSWRAALVTSLIFGIISLSLVVVTGLAGQVSLAQLTLAGVAGFSLAPITTDWHVPFPIAPLLAACFAVVVGLVVGLPALRVRGLPLAVVTLTLAVAIEAVWFRNPSIVPSGGSPVKGPYLFGYDLRARIGTYYPTLPFSIMVLIVLIATGVGVALLRRSRLGSAMLAIRANERSAAAAGIHVLRVKLAAFGIGAFIAGIGGSLLAYKLEAVTFDSFEVILGLAVFATVYLAGITSVSGGVLGGILAANGLVYLALDRWLSLGDWYATITGLGLVLTVIINPEGVLGPVHARLATRNTARSPNRVALAPAVSSPSSVSSSAAASADGEALLSVRDLRVAYGGVVAVNGVSFDVAPGRIVGLIGPNGAGKTTLLDALSGLTRSSGTIELQGSRIDSDVPFRRARAGLGRTFQAIELYEDMTVRENVLAGLAGSNRHNGDSLERTLQMLDLTDLADQIAGALPQGRRQLVSIARALIAEPALLLLDEPASGLDTTESLWLRDRLAAIRDSGVSLLLIDHDMSLVLSLCDEVHVLDFGNLISSGPPAAVQKDPAVVAAYLGSSVTRAPVSAS
jgi:ABC-type branched-subunit amino acid transport system ATPase component/ABC-type branched-subunit amino acid transport system permease subunit